MTDGPAYLADDGEVRAAAGAVGAVVVVVPTLNEAKGISRVLAELGAGLPRDRPAEIVVADGGSTDGTGDIVREAAKADPRIRLLDNPARFQSAAVNRVARDVAGTATYLVRADAHAAYPPGFVAGVVAALERTGASSVVVPMDSVGRTCVGRAIAWVSDSAAGSGGSAHRGGQASGWVDHGHHAGWRLDAFLAAGGYDESYSHNEDAELDCRLRAVGGRVWLEAGVRFDYQVRSTLGALWRQYRNYGRGRSRTVRRHPGSMRARQAIVPAFVGTNAAALLVGLIWPWALLLPVAYFAALSAVSVRITWRYRSPCGLFAGLAALVMHVAWAIGFCGGLLFVREQAWVPAP